MPPSTRWCSQEIHARSWPFSSRFFRSLSQAAPDVGAALRDTHTHCHGSTFRQTRNAGGYHVPNGRQSSHMQNKHGLQANTQTPAERGLLDQRIKGTRGGRGAWAGSPALAHRTQRTMPSFLQLLHKYGLALPPPQPLSSLSRPSTAG